jgi:heme/copper-type cytochrome/quinol oxidase subunit 2
MLFLMNLADWTGKQKNIRWFLLCLFGLLIIIVPIPEFTGDPQSHIIHVEAARFAYTPERIRVNPGDTVTIELAAQDVVHGLAIDGYDVALMADPGRTERMTFTADKPGVFRIRCSVTCGEMHPFMIGKFQVGPNLLYLRGLGLAILAAITFFWRRF